MNHSYVLRASKLFKSYSADDGSKTPIIKGVDVDVAPGEFLAITGPSGAGKSTLLYLLGGLEPADSGTVHLINGGKTHEITSLADAELAAVRTTSIGFIFQFHHLLAEFSVAENVMMPGLIAGWPDRKARARALELLAEVGMEHRVNYRPSQLSGGEQQRVAIARALFHSPPVLLADEPTGNLDEENGERVMELFSAVRNSFSCACILVTHNEPYANRADRRLHMRGGTVDHYTTKEER